jgi:hypothetical protein
LAEDANGEIDSAIGGFLRERATRDDWRKCVILQQLEAGRSLGGWNELFCREKLCRYGIRWLAIFRRF